ncbi:MAG: hypothetical protein JXR83_00115 [Deltaproteobacteria bacterium]|nr:hypothetical protein [Deltaproteobacteria bacterium]
MRARHIPIVVVAIALTGLAPAQMEIFGPPKPAPFFHPKGFYALGFPGGWSYELNKSGDLVASAQKGMDRAELTLSMRSVPKDADTENVALNAAKALRKLPHFKDGGGGRLKIAGKPASVRSFEFDWQGNTEYTIAVEELYVVSGPVLFTLHFEAMKRSFPAYRNDLKTIYDSLMVAEIDADGKPFKVVSPKPVKDNSGVPNVNQIGW